MYHLPRLDTRINALLLGTALLVLVIIGRLFMLQITLSSHYQARGEKNFLHTQTTAPKRGNILDCNGALLATNRPIAQLVWHGTGNRILTPLQKEMLCDIGQMLQDPTLSTQNSLAKVQTTERYYRQYTLAQDITPEQLSKVCEKYGAQKNISIQTSFERFYPLGPCASHLIGYLSRSAYNPSNGQMGLEKMCDTILKGQQGTILETINSVGRKIEETSLKKAAAGANIVTTLDLSLQKIAETIFPEDRAGAVLIMDPANGNIKAMVSRPHFDPSLFLEPISHDTWQALQVKKPFINRALSAYPLGSIFKLITISAAMEQGLLSEHQQWQCDGYVEFAGRKYWCSRRWGHGELSTAQAVAHSCNVLFFEIGKKIDIDLLNTYAKKFGLGEPTGIMFPEKIGIVPSREWKLYEKGEQWWPGETLSVTIGQSYLMATPIQICRMISSIFSGYLVKPRILESDPIETQALNLQPQTIDFLKESMRFVVTTGTGRRVNAVKDIEIYAKTSTAQIADFQKRKLGEQFLEHAWFVAYFQYKNFDPLCFVIFVENAGTSLVATTIAKQFLLAYKEYAQTLAPAP